MRRLIALVALITLLAGGCGIPDNSGVTVVGNGPSGGLPAGDDGVVPDQNTRESTAEPAQLVKYYLQAAAGDPEGALGRVKAFLSPEAATAFKPAADLRVIRLTEPPLYTPGDPEIKVTAQLVGLLKSNGVLEPTPDPSPVASKYQIRVGPVKGEDGLFVTDAPQALMITDDALNLFYQRRTIYFWNTAYTALVPDVRYMPKMVPTAQQPTIILSWLANGPASWLADSVQSLPAGTAARDNVPAKTNDTLQVNLTAQALPPNDDKAPDRLRRQLQWSLRPLMGQTLELRVGHEDPVKYGTTDYWTSNPSYRLANSPERFVIYGGAVRRLADSARLTDPLPLLKPADNKNITAAAMSASATHTFGALVTGKRLRVASAPTGEVGDFKDVTGLRGTLGRPLWAITADGDPDGAIGLITVDGRLYSFGPKGGPAKRVQWQADPGLIAAISVAPDAHRVALVANGRLYRTTLTIGDDGLSLDAPEQLMPPTLASVAAVAWSSEGWLTVAGVRTDRRVSIMDVSVDGVLQTPRLPDIGDKTVSYLTAYPASPLNTNNSNTENSPSVSYTAVGQAWDVFSAAVQITTANLAGPTPTAPPDSVPTAPFYLD